jgi:hypothetical protein
MGTDICDLPITRFVNFVKNAQNVGHMPVSDTSRLKDILQSQQVITIINFVIFKL